MDEFQLEIQWTEVHACEIIQLFSVVFWVVRDVLKYDFRLTDETLNPYPTAFPYGNGMVLHYQQQESSTTKTVHRVINKGLETYV